MADFWCFVSGGRLVFGYRTRRWDTVPVRYMNATELTGVAAAAYDEAGSPIPIAQQPSYVASLQGWIGWISASSLIGKTFISMVLTPTLGAGLPAAWGPVKAVDTRIDQSLALAVAALATGDVQEDNFIPV